MLEELAKALGPWPVLQLLFGLSVLAVGIYAIVRGARGKEDLRDQRAKWEAQEQLKNIEENSFKLVKLQEKLVEAVDRLATVLWNQRQ